MGEPFMLNGVPSDFYVDREERHLAPEEVYEERLRGDALAASKDFFVLLHQPLVLTSIAQHLAHVEIERVGLAYHTSEDQARYIFHVLVNEPLCFEIVQYVARDATVYFFGTKYPSLGVPLSVLSATPEMATCLTRMCMRAQPNAHSTTTHAPNHGINGSAFAQISANRVRNSVTYANFAFDALFDVRFPRAALLAAYVLSFLGNARAVDTGAYESLRHSNGMGGAGGRASSPALRRTSSSGGGGGGGGDSDSPSRSLHSSSNSLNSMLVENEASMYARALLVVRSSLRKALSPAQQRAGTPTTLRRMRVRVGSEHGGEVRVLEEAPADGEGERRAAFMCKACAALLQKLNDAKDGELVVFYEEVLVLINRSMSSLYAIDNSFSR